METASDLAREVTDIIDALVMIVRATADPALAAHRWAVILDAASPFDATYALASAAVSSEPTIRRTAAEALIWEFPVVGAHLILDHLGCDPDATIRFAAARAAQARRRSVGDTLLHRLCADPVSLVADAAAFALATRW
jgi:hypothetical protein